MNLDPVLVKLAIAAVFCALVPAYLFTLNLRRYLPAPRPAKNAALPPISVLIPARDEEASIGQAVSSVLANAGVEFEVIVLDDHSTDATATIVAEIAARDERVRLVQAPPLPVGWSGKQHACWRLAHLARHPLLLFLDADVRLKPDALARSATFLDASGADLVSGIPHQETVGFLEKLVIPLIHFILLGFLPMRRMRRSTSPSYAAGCGQLFLTRKEAYFRSGGHAEIRASFHDGIKLPDSYRRAGLKTDLFDPTEIASCRMYRSASSLWNGLAKNAGEGLATPRLILPMTLILVFGQVLPILLVLFELFENRSPERGRIMGLSLGALALSIYPRLVMAGRFRQSWLGAWLHPLGILVLLAIQWYSLGLRVLGQRVSWKGREAPVHFDNLEMPDQPLIHEDIESSHGTDRTVENSARK